MWHLLGDVSADGGAQVSQQSCSVCAAPERAQTLPHLCVPSALPLFRQALDCSGNPSRNVQRIHPKTQKGSCFRGFSPFLSLYFLHHSNQFWADGHTAALSGTLCVLGALCSLISEPKLTQLLLESVGISGVCSPVPVIRSVLAMGPPSLVALVISRTSQWGVVCNCWACTALLAKTLPCCRQQSTGAFSVCQNFRAPEKSSVKSQRSGVGGCLIYSLHPALKGH